MVARIILRPLEESCFVYFSRYLTRASSTTVEREDAAAAKIPPKLVAQFVQLCRSLVTFGAIVAAFSIPYSSLAVNIYGGKQRRPHASRRKNLPSTGALLAKNHGARLLSINTFYHLVMALNGTIECFAFASM